MDNPGDVAVPQVLPGNSEGICQEAMELAAGAGPFIFLKNHTPVERKAVISIALALCSAAILRSTGEEESENVHLAGSV